MMRSSRLTTLLAVALSAVAAAIADATAAEPSTTTGARDADTCRALGFDADVLDCRRCDELASFLGDNLTSDKKRQASQVLDADCRKCCTDLSAAGHGGAGGQQYDRVVLEVCTCKFGRYPKVANFVHYHADKHAKLEIKVQYDKLCLLLLLLVYGGVHCGIVCVCALFVIKYINARHPFLIFYDAEGTKKEEIGISSWDEDTISEFIVAKIKKSDDETPAPVEEAQIEGANGGIVQGETTADADADAESSTSTTEETAEILQDMEVQEPPTQETEAPETENDEL